MLHLHSDSCGSFMTSFIKPSTGDDQLHTHINQTVLKLLHERAGLTASFMTDVYESPDWTVFPTMSSAESNQSLTGKFSLSFVFIFLTRGLTT